MSKCKTSRIPLVIVSTALFTLTSACTITPIPAERLSSLRKMGAISLLGDELEMQYVGTTAFTNSTKEISVKNRKIDRYVVQTIKDEIVGKSKFDFKTPYFIPIM